nr:ORF1 [Fig badnavirus 2]UVT37310.1 ORF1 [Fig badnavirus 2]
MSERWEREIQDWYNNSRTINLEYLDLAESEKPKLSHIYNNLAVLYDRVSLFSRVSIKNFKSVLERIEKVEERLGALEKGVKTLTKEITESRPLTAQEVRDLVTEIARQPKLVEEEALKISGELSQKLARVEALLHKVESRATT